MSKKKEFREYLEEAQENLQKKELQEKDLQEKNIQFERDVRVMEILLRWCSLMRLRMIKEMHGHE